MLRYLMLALVLTAHNAAAQTCRLALSLAMDVSASVDATEYAQQRDGLAAALEHREVVEAVFATAGSTIALHVYEWSGRRNQAVVLDWALVRDPAHLRQIALTVRGAQRSQTEFPTSLGNALGFGAVALNKGPDCDRRTLDVSGDGRNNDGFTPKNAYDSFDFSNIIVNGLAIGSADGEILPYYISTVIHGPGAFVEYAADYNDYAKAIKRKLIREIGEQQMTHLMDFTPSK